MKSNMEQESNGRIAEVHDIFTGSIIADQGHEDGDVSTEKAIAKLKFTEDIGYYGWQEEAACQDADPELFFSEDIRLQHAAAMICRDCVVVKECLDFAVRNDEMYVWAGTYHTRVAKGLRTRRSGS